jgi:hypothetical protein
MTHEGAAIELPYCPLQGSPLEVAEALAVVVRDEPLETLLGHTPVDPDRAPVGVEPRAVRDPIPDRAPLRAEEEEPGRLEHPLEEIQQLCPARRVQVGEQ